MPGDKNENWGVCSKCGSPVLIDPKTSKPEACSNCAAKSSPWGFYLGTLSILLGAGMILLILIISIRMLLG